MIQIGGQTGIVAGGLHHACRLSVQTMRSSCGTVLRISAAAPRLAGHEVRDLRLPLHLVLA